MTLFNPRGKHQTGMVQNPTDPSRAYMVCIWDLCGWRTEEVALYGPDAAPDAYEQLQKAEQHHLTWPSEVRHFTVPTAGYYSLNDGDPVLLPSCSDCSGPVIDGRCPVCGRLA